MKRQYDPSLVVEIQKKTYSAKTGELDTIFKPIPDDDKKDVLDRRVLSTAIKKKEIHKTITYAPKYSLFSQRYRPDKVNYDLTESEITEEETLIPIGGGHYIDCFFYSKPSSQKNRPALIFLHGGGFTAGDHTGYRNAMKLIAEQSGGIVIFPEYRLAPENPFPAGVEDSWGTVTWVFQNAEQLGIDPDRIMVAGDSAGGNCALGCAIKDNDHIIKELVALYPAVDSTPLEKLTAYSWSYDLYPVIEEHREYAYNRIDRIKDGSPSLENYYLQGRADYTNPLVSPVYYNNLKKFPKTIIASAEYDYLRVSDDYFAFLLKQNGVDVTNIRYLGCDHGFMDCLGIEPQAEEFCLLMAKELSSLA